MFVLTDGYHGTPYGIRLQTEAEASSLHMLLSVVLQQRPVTRLEYIYETFIVWSNSKSCFIPPHLSFWLVSQSPHPGWRAAGWGWDSPYGCPEPVYWGGEEGGKEESWIRQICTETCKHEQLSEMFTVRLSDVSTHLVISCMHCAL